MAVLFLQVKKNGVLYILILNQIKVENMYFTGFADEASKNIEGQINAALELGWKILKLVILTVSTSVILRMKNLLDRLLFPGNIVAFVKWVSAQYIIELNLIC